MRDRHSRDFRPVPVIGDLTACIMRDDILRLPVACRPVHAAQRASACRTDARKAIQNRSHPNCPDLLATLSLKDLYWGRRLRGVVLPEAVLSGLIGWNSHVEKPSKLV